MHADGALVVIVISKAFGSAGQNDHRLGLIADSTCCRESRRGDATGP
jgi:hypothetical protein